MPHDPRVFSGGGISPPRTSTGPSAAEIRAMAAAQSANTSSGSGSSANAAPPSFVSGNAPDLFFGGASSLSNRRAPSPNRLETFRVYGPDGKVMPGVIRWEYTVFDLSGGLDGAEGQPDNRLSFSSLDHRWPNTLILNALAATAASPDPTSPAVISHTNIFNTLVMGLGSAANTSLIKATSATDPTPTALTWTPGGMVTYVHQGVYGGVANANSLAVCRIGDSIEIFSDAGTTPTSRGEIASTAPGWGIVTVPLNNTTPGASTHLVYYSTQIGTKPSDDTLTTTPTAALTAIPGGGGAIGSLSLGDSFQRAWWHIPRSSTASTSMYAAAGAVIGDVMSTNWEGTDPQILDVPLPYVSQVTRWRNGLVMTDGRSVYWHNGQKQNLHWQFQREPAADREVVCNSFARETDRLIAIAVEYNVVTDAVTNAWLEEYIPETDAWYQITATTAMTSAPIRATGQGQPVAHMTGSVYGSSWVYLRNSTDWFWWKMTPPDSNPYYMARSTSSATVGTIYAYAASGVARSKQIFLSGLEGSPSVVYEIQPLFDVSQGGTGATVAISVANQGSNSLNFTNAMSATFRAADRWDNHIWRNMDNTSAFNRFQFQITATRGSDTLVTMNCLPIIFRGLTFLDGEVRKPSDVLNLKAV